MANLGKKIVLLFIRAYQKTLSPDHGLFRFAHPNGYCRFYPSCSEYGYKAFDRHGLCHGGYLTIWRLLRCHPWSSGGNDPVPEEKEKRPV